MLSSISARQLGEWMAYYAVEPFGAERSDLQAGVVAAAIYNVHRDPKRQRHPFGPADFRLTFEPPQRDIQAEDPAVLFEKLKFALGLSDRPGAPVEESEE